MFTPAPAPFPKWDPNDLNCPGQLGAASATAAWTPPRASLAPPVQLPSTPDPAAPGDPARLCVTF